MLITRSKVWVAWSFDDDSTVSGLQIAGRNGWLRQRVSRGTARLPFLFLHPSSSANGQPALPVCGNRCGELLKFSYFYPFDPLPLFQRFQMQSPGRDSVQGACLLPVRHLRHQSIESVRNSSYVRRS